MTQEIQVTLTLEVDVEDSIEVMHDFFSKLSWATTHSIKIEEEAEIYNTNQLIL